MPETDEYKDFDVNAAVAEISGDLFSAENPKDEVPESEPPVEATAPENPPSAELPAPEPIDPLPKSWKKDMEEDWKTLPDSVRKYVYKREQDVLSGIQQYHSGHQNYSALVEPFKEVFSQHPDVQPVQLFQNLMQSHMKLLTLPPAEKAVFAKELLSAYGVIDGTESQAAALPPGYQQMQAELAETRRIIRENQAAAHAAEVQRYEKEISDFASKNPLFPEVQNDILRLISTGAAVDLKSAYETAVWANPVTRVKLIAEQQAAEALKNPRQKSPMTNIESSGAARVNRKPASMDATVDAVIAKHFPTH